MTEKQEEKIVLTLDDNTNEQQTTTQTETPTTQTNNALDESKLSEEEKRMVNEFADKIDVMQTNTILQYGSGAQSKVADFSESALNNVKTKDFDTVGDTLVELVSQLKSFDVDSKKDGFFERLFKKGANKINDMKAKYDDVNKNVDKIVKVLENHQITLMKDINILDQLYEKNLINQKELTMYILAGNKKLAELKAKDLPAALARAKETGLPEDAQKANDLSEAINRFEKKIHDLELTRVVAIQMAPQIRLVQNNDVLMTEKIESTLVNTIPIWKSQMLIALGIAHSKEAVKAQNEVSEMTNQMLKQNAENLKIATIETAKESERGIVDIETLTETSQKLIDTLEEVKKIQIEGREKRAQAQQELRRIETTLQQNLTDVINK